ncbi:MAG TPA: PAS domain-containing protein, partial [Polyangiaceae bacterium]|nr:PAS domain-containing protein [Polyangiaceae bacterium]
MDHRTTLVERTLAITEQIAHIGSWEWQVQANTVRWSDELYRIYGFAPQSRPITPEFFLSRVYPDDRELVQQGVRLALERGGKFHWRERIVRPDGSVRLLDTVGEVLADEGGTALLGTCRDMTEEQQRLDQLRRFADICQNIQIGLSVWAPNAYGDSKPFLLTTFNPVLESIAGLSLGPLLGQPFRSIFPNAEDGAIEALLSEVARAQQTYEVDATLLGCDGLVRHLSCKGFPLPGRSVGLALLDVTQQTRERTLQAAEHAVLEQVATGAPLQRALETLILAVEEHAPPTIGSILLLDADGMRVRHGAAPSLPSAYQAGIDGSRIGPRAGSCGTAAFLRRAVFVDDIETDPLWEDYRDLALSHDL